MDASLLKDYLFALKRELITYKLYVVIVFVATTFIFLVMAFMLPKSYKTSALLYADETNIIEPLLKGRAEITEINRTEVARDQIYTRRLLEAVAEDLELLNGSESPQQHGNILSSLRGSIGIKSEGKNYFRISYGNKNPDQSFDALNAVVNVFIEDAARQKKEESLSAFNFINAQVKSYKRQLELAESKLKDFKSANVDGTEKSVTDRIAALRSEIENINITIDEYKSRIATIKQQLTEESQYQQEKDKLTSLVKRQTSLQDDLEQLRLSYQEDYPDIAAIKAQLEELSVQIKTTRDSDQVVPSSGGEAQENPLYEDLRKQLSEAEVNLKAQKRRKKSLEKLQQDEFLRAQKVASNQAELTELTRDYDVTRDVYEEMLSRKESARLSMTLDIEGQGVSYKIQEPASFPLKPSGLRFIHLALIAPILGMLLPIALLVGYVVLDPSFRSSKLMMNTLPEDIVLLGDIPHYNTPLASRLLRKDMRQLLIVVAVSLLVYVLAVTLGLALDV